MTRRDADRPPTRDAQPLAHAFLALADDHVEADQRTLPRAVVAAVAAVVLAIGAPLGFLVVPARPPVAAPSSKFALATIESPRPSRAAPWQPSGCQACGLAEGAERCLGAGRCAGPAADAH